MHARPRRVWQDEKDPLKLLQEEVELKEGKKAQNDQQNQHQFGATRAILLLT